MGICKQSDYTILRYNQPMKPVFATPLQDTPWGGQNLGQTFPNLSTLISLILNNSLVIIGLLLLILLIFGGLSYILGAGSGDPKKAQQGQKAITSALIGFAIVFLSYAIIQIIEFITDLDIFNSNL